MFLSVAIRCGLLLFAQMCYEHLLFEAVRYYMQLFVAISVFFGSLGVEVALTQGFPRSPKVIVWLPVWIVSILFLDFALDYSWVSLYLYTFGFGLCLSLVGGSLFGIA